MADHDTLFDENAASHIAVGSAYKSALVDGEAMSDETFGQIGGNSRAIHIDLMIGSDELYVDGVHDSGATEPIMRAGEWACG